MAIETLRPNADGTHIGIPSQSPSDGAHWDKVDEVEPDYADTCLLSTGVEEYDLFALPAYTGSESIDKVTIFAVTGGAYTLGLCTVIRTHNTEYYGEAQSPSATWETFSTVYTLNPYTNLAWSIAEVDALEAGIKLKPETDETDYCTQVYVEVNYTTLGSATLSGTGSMVASAVTTLVGKATLSGNGVLVSVGRLIGIGKAALSGIGSLVAKSDVTYSRILNLLNRGFKECSDLSEGGFGNE